MLNRGYAYTTIISSKHHGQNLLSHLASLYPHSTAEAWQQKLNSGEVTLNGITATGSESVTFGQTLVWKRPPWIEPDSPQHFEVLFEDPHLLAVNKPSGLPTLPGAGFMENTLVRLVQKRTRTQTLSTGWAEPLPASSSSPKHRRRPLNYSQTGTHPKFKNLPGAGSKLCPARRLRNPHTHRPGTAPAYRFRVGRHPKWQTVKVIGKSDLTHHQHHDI